MTVKVYKLPDTPKSDISISTFNTGRAWNCNENGVRITYWPTRIVIECGSERSVHANKAKCMERLEQILKYPTN